MFIMRILYILRSIILLLLVLRVLHKILDISILCFSLLMVENFLPIFGLLRIYQLNSVDSMLGLLPYVFNTFTTKISYLGILSHKTY
jgi:hypothetical protein